MKKINRKTFLVTQIGVLLILGLWVVPLVLYGFEVFSNFLRLSPFVHDMVQIGRAHV